MKNMTKALSDISRTNQLKLIENPKQIAEQLYRYLFKMGKGIESFSANDLDLSKYEESSLNKYQKRHRAIKHKIKKRLQDHGEDCDYSDIRYFLSYFDGKNYVFFFTPNENDSTWRNLFYKDRSNRERILNLIFKVHILLEGLSFDTINGFEELVLIHSTSQDKKGIVVWGQKLLIQYNHHDVLTLTLSRKKLLFLKKDPYITLDGDEMGEVLVYKNKKYYFSNELDGRKQNSIKFMFFPVSSDNNPIDKFQKTQLYHYQNFMTKLEKFLNICGIAYEKLNFQADHYLQNSFIKNIDAVENLEIINNSGIDLTESDKQNLEKFITNQGISTISFFNAGKTISTYERVENEEKVCWKIKEIIIWANIELKQSKNYLVFNKILDDETSMAYYDDDFWYPTTDIYKKSIDDFYSQLKKKFNYWNNKEFFSIQGINVTNFSFITDLDKKIPPKLKKILIELGIKNWIRKSLLYPIIPKLLDDKQLNLLNGFLLPINSQSFSEKRFFTIYVRKPRKQKAKAVAVEFLYKDGNLYIKNVLSDLKQIEKQFRFLRRRKNDSELRDNQQYFVDEEKQVFISCYTDIFFTPTLIGHPNIINDLENGTLQINRQQGNKFLPLILYYNDNIKSTIKNIICLDLHNEEFIQYYVPSAISPDQIIKKGFRVYHLLGKSYSGETIPTTELIKHPITSLHFNTLTHNILKISDNSQSSLLQKVAKIFIEN